MTDFQSSSAVSHMSSCTSFIQEISMGWELTFWLVISRQRSTSACADLCPLILHALLYNKTSSQLWWETGLSCSRSYQSRLGGVRRLQEVSVNNAIGFQLLYAQALMQNSALLYVHWEAAEAGGRGYVLTGKPSELHNFLSNPDRNVCKLDLRVWNRNINCCTYTWRHPSSCCSFLSSSSNLLSLPFLSSSRVL